LLTEILEIVLNPKILGPPETGGPRLKPYSPNGKSAPEQQYSECGFSTPDARVLESSHCPHLVLEVHIRLLPGVWLHCICWYWYGCTSH